MVKIVLIEETPIQSETLLGAIRAIENTECDSISMCLDGFCANNYKTFKQLVKYKIKKDIYVITNDITLLGLAEYDYKEKKHQVFLVKRGKLVTLIKDTDNEDDNIETVYRRRING